MIGDMDTTGKAQHDAALAEVRASSVYDAPASLGLVAEIVSAFDKVVNINESVERALQAMALSFDRYEHENAEIRRRLDECEGEIRSLNRDMQLSNRLHSVKR